MTSRFEGGDFNPAEAKRRKKSSVWLDLLPVDVCLRIASMLPSGRLRRQVDTFICLFELDTDLLNLAAVSNEQQRAVAASQERVLRVEQVNDFKHAETLMRSWHEVLGNNIREVRLSSDVAYKSSEAIRKVLSLPSIVKASIPHFQSLLNALRVGRSVKQLRVEFTEWGPDSDDDTADLSQVIRSCAVEDLRLVCKKCFHASGQIPYRPCYSALCLELISKVGKCDSVRSLELLCHTTDKLRKLLQPASGLPKLEKLRLELSRQPLSLPTWSLDVSPLRSWDFKLSSDLGNQLRYLRSVSMVNCGSVNRIVPILGERLTSFTSQQIVSDAALQKLGQCPNLQSVDLLLECWTDYHFPTNICSLRSLSLGWSPRVEVRGGECHSFVTPKTEFLLGLVRSNKLLEEFRLKGVDINMFISPPLLEDILVCLGDRLRSLQVPISEERDTFPTQFRQMLRLIMRHNPNIVDLLLGQENLLDSYSVCSRSTGCTEHESREFLYEEYEADCETCMFWKRADAFLRVPKARLPRLSSASVTSLRWYAGLLERMKVL